MKRFTTVLLMIAILLTFTQKVLASTPLLASDIQSMSHCDSAKAPDSVKVPKAAIDTTNCGEQMISMENCISICEMVNIVSFLHVIENTPQLSFQVSTLRYSIVDIRPDYYFSEPLYRPPFII